MTLTIQGQDLTLQVPTDGAMTKYLDGLVDEQGQQKPKGIRLQRVNLVILLVVDPATGEPLFNEGHVPEITRWPFDVLQKIEATAKGFVSLPSAEELEKNSDAMSADDSP